MSWGDIKELFLIVGSAAGVIAFFRPILETKYSKDIKRVEHVQSLLNEQILVDLEAIVEQTRIVPAKIFDKFDQIAHERRTNQDCVRFTGPLAKHLSNEIDSFIDAYMGLRDYIQVNEWEPKKYTEPDGTETYYWEFNKAAFSRESGYPKDYANHLREAAVQANKMLIAYQRFQIVSEMHILEVPIAKFLLKHRFKSHELELPS